MAEEIIIVVGLGFGDEGKGSIVDYLVRTRKAGVVVRFNGGAQAGHNVVTPEGLHHTFSQFGSGTFVPGVKTHLSRFMAWNPLSMLREEEHLRSLGIKDAFRRITIDEEALITTPFQISVNRILHNSGQNKNSTCGVGVGQTIKDHFSYGDKVLFAKDIKNAAILKGKLSFLREKSRNAVQEYDEWLGDKTAVDDLVRLFSNFGDLVEIVKRDYFKGLIQENQVIIFEGAQGVLPDKDVGYRPYITQSNTTDVNARRLIKEAGYDGKVTRIGVLRAYATRHGSGPFPGEDEALTKILKDDHNTYNQWQGNFRVGWLNEPLIRYAIAANGGVDCIALTNIDRLSELSAIKDFSNWQEYISFLQSKAGLGVPVKILSFGPTWREKTLK